MADALDNVEILPSRDEVQARVNTAAQEAGLNPAFVSRLVQQESGWNPAVGNSKKGAVGLFQILPSTAKDYGVTDPHDTNENIKAGIAHLKRLQEKFNGNETLMAAAYNAGEGAVHQHGDTVPPFAETQKYVKNVAPTNDNVEIFDPLAEAEAAKPKPKPPSPAELKKQENVQKYAQTNPSLWEQIKNRSGLSGAIELGKGFVKAAGDTATNLGQAVSAVPVLGPALNATGNAIGGAVGQAVYGTQAEPVSMVDAAKQAKKELTPQNIPQKVGKFIERGAELAVPAGQLANVSRGAALGTAIAEQVPLQAALGMGEAKLHDENPLVGAASGAVGGVLGPTIEAVGPMATKYAVNRMQAAVKPTNALLKGWPVNARGVTPNVRATQLAQYISDNKLTPESATKLTEEMGNVLDAARSGPGQQIVPDVAQRVEQALADVRTKFPNAQVSKDIDAILEKLYTKTPGTPAVPASTTLGPNGQPLVPAQPAVPPTRVPRTDVTADEALQLAQDMKPINRGSFGVEQPATRQAGKMSEVALRDAAKTVPEIAAAQEGFGKAITAAEALTSAAKRIGNREAVNPFQRVQDAVALAGMAAAPFTGGSSLIVGIPSLLSRYAQKHPIEAAHMARTIADSMSSGNTKLLAQAIQRLTQTAAMQATEQAPKQ